MTAPLEQLPLPLETVMTTEQKIKRLARRMGVTVGDVENMFTANFAPMRETDPTRAAALMEQYLDRLLSEYAAHPRTAAHPRRRRTGRATRGAVRMR